MVACGKASPHAETYNAHADEDGERAVSSPSTLVWRPRRGLHDQRMGSARTEDELRSRFTIGLRGLP